MGHPDCSKFMDLINGPPVAALTTVMPDGQPQTTVVWCDFNGTLHSCYYGHVFPVEQMARETRVICRIQAQKITLGAIHK